LHLRYKLLRRSVDYCFSWVSYLEEVIVCVHYSDTLHNIEEGECMQITVMCRLHQQTSPKHWLGNVNMTSYYDVKQRMYSNNDHNTPLLNTRIW